MEQVKAPIEFADRLERFFSELKHALPLHKATLEAPKEINYPTSNDLSQFFTVVREPLERARANGELLNIWSIAGLGIDELQNAAILKWLLDCNERHGQGSQFWESLLRQIANALPANFPVGPHLWKTYVAGIETYPLSDTENRIDIELESDSFLIFIEVKVKASERDKIESYLGLLSRKAGNRQSCLLLVCPSSEGIPARPQVVIVTWGDIAKAVDDVARNKGTNFLGTTLRQLSQHFATLSRLRGHRLRPKPSPEVSL